MQGNRPDGQGCRSQRVYFASAAPAVRFPTYGIDMPVASEPSLMVERKKKLEQLIGGRLLAGVPGSARPD